MPELPEVEHLRRTLVPAVIGAQVLEVHVHRADVVDRSGYRRRASMHEALLVGRRIDQLRRHGKQLAFQARSVAGSIAPVFCVQLGMSGSMGVVRDRAAESIALPEKHRHVDWTLRTRRGATVRLYFHDPRRFGGVWCADHQTTLEERWNELGPDALTIEADALRDVTRAAQRPIKALLLDQARIAGIGNIYADESLFRAGIAPRARSSRLSPDRVAALAAAIRAVLGEAIDSGGSTIRDYVDSAGRAGEFQNALQVYGRAGEPCMRCGTVLRSARLSGRTTVWCRSCQR